ncbi:hypothetical protein [Kingella negevensis]|nr:hypothetical protein [Kingella negevensis]MDK4679915.1 hypothetical protein [Kingella negevensis]MDK4682366.1 hypothetical protein [Kingella negevensis]MDK4690563.1 hypothetical protein [Kingella negevensis]MDK4692089.1 hypothetical protein [Kingella negevensis]
MGFPCVVSGCDLWGFTNLKRGCGGATPRSVKNNEMGFQAAIIKATTLRV